MMQLAGQLRASWCCKGATVDTAQEGDEGQMLFPACAAVRKRRYHWRRGHKFQAALKKQGEPPVASDVGEQIISYDQWKQLAGRIKTNEIAAKEGRQHEEDALGDKLIVNLSHGEQVDKLPLSQLEILHRPQDRSAATMTLAAIGAHLRRLKLHFILLALLMALNAGATRLSRRSISNAGQAYNHLGNVVSPHEKQAAAELVARQLLTSYYRNKILSQQMAHLNADPIQHQTQPQQQVLHQETANQHQNQPLNHQPRENEFDGSSWTTSSELMSPANSLHEFPIQSQAIHQGAVSEHNFVAHQPGTAPVKQTDATPPVAGNSFAGHEPMQPQQQQQQLTTPTLNKQLPPPTSYEFGLAPTKAIQLEPVAASSDHVASLVQAPSSSRQQSSNFRQSAHGAHPSESIVQPQIAKPSPTDTSARHMGGDSTRNGRQYNGDPVADTFTGESSSSSADSSKFDQSQDPTPAPVTEKGVEPRQRRRMFNRILKKAEWNHLFVELSKVFVRYFLDLALKDIIGKQSGGTGSSSDSSSSSTTSGRKKLDAQSELTDLLKDFVKTAISNM